jgi:hypothetical protein
MDYKRIQIDSIAIGVNDINNIDLISYFNYNKLIQSFPF